MNLMLRRDQRVLYGVFGTLTTEHGEDIAVTLEHSYGQPNGNFLPKLPEGTYECKRGTHHLAGRGPFETFEVTGVVGHTGILFHKGNYNADSEGCILLGTSLGTGCILDSADAFEKFLGIQAGVDTFTLIVA